MTQPTRDATTAHPPVGVCSWSLQPGSVTELVDRVRATGLSAIQLALDPVRTGVMPLEEVQPALQNAGIAVLSGMMAMVGEDYSTLESIRHTGGVALDGRWPQNRANARDNARIARALGIRLVTFHAGFLPHDVHDPRRRVLLDRVREIAATFREQGVAVALESGQESADTLLLALDTLGGDVGVNFDPANMILYGMGDPVGALRQLAQLVVQVHIKDAVPPGTPGTWGSEVPVGTGSVDWAAFFAVLAGHGTPPALVIEREAGTDRIADIRTARQVIAAAGAT
jgi:L-ribulose-5-phosphate 3-epimerase